jgi:iron complex outermembrane receptor protein
MCNRYRFSRGAVLFAGLAQIVPLEVSGQEATGSGTLEEVIVTAQKRAQDIQDVGIAVTALGERALKQFDTNDTLALAIAVPSLQINQYSPGVVTTNIRGVSQSDYSDFQEGPNAFYVDEVYISANGAVAGQMFDLARLEVLRGPQGTLFGRNATGGLIHAVTARPTRHWEGYATVTVGDYDQIASEAAVSGPLSEAVSMRLSLTSDRSDGYYPNLFPGGEDGGNSRFYGGRAQFLFDVTPNDTLLLKGEYLRNDEETGNHVVGRAAGVDPTTQLGTLEPNAWGSIAPFIPQDEGSYFFPFPTFSHPYNVSPYDAPPYFTPGSIGSWTDGCAVAGYCFSSARFTHEADFPGIFDREYFSVTARYEHAFRDGPTLTSVSNYQQLDKTVGLDVDASPFPLIHPLNLQDMTQWSQEFRLAEQAEGIDWVVGIYWLSSDSEVLGNTFVNPAVAEFFAGAPLGSFGAQGRSTATQSTESGAIFGQVDYALSKVITLVAGVRFTRDVKEYQFVNFDELDPSTRVLTYDFRNRFVHDRNFALDYPFDDIAPDLSHLEYDDWSGKLQLEARPNPDTLLYVGVNRGTKAGGYNQPTTWPFLRDYFPDFDAFDAALIAFNEQMRFDEEVLTSP